MHSISELFHTRPDQQPRIRALLSRLGIADKRHITRMNPAVDRSLEGQVVNGKTLTVQEARARRDILTGDRALSLDKGRARVQILSDDIRRAVASHPPGQRIHAALKAGRLTKSWLALATGIDKSQITYIDRREPKVQRALAIAKTLGVTVEDLWGE